MYYTAHTIFRVYWSIYFPDFLSIVQLDVLEHIFRKLSLQKISINLNNIDMSLLRTSYISTGSSSNNILDFKLVRLVVYIHGKTLS